MKTRLSKIVLLLLLALLETGNGLFAASTKEAINPNFFGDLAAQMVLGITVVLFFSVMFILVHLFSIIVKNQEIRIYQEQGMEAYLEQKKIHTEPFWTRLRKRLTRVVPIEKEEDILFDHEYDGIRELDNSLPPWWVGMFYATIIIGVVYIGYYHFSDYGLSSSEAYAQEMKDAHFEIEQFLAKQANKVDETNVELLTDAALLEQGATIFKSNCATCHGQLGEGIAGPNLTDDFWIHGGDIKAVFRTIKYGVPAKGMIAWKTQLPPTEIHKVASFIMTLQGTNPPNPKAPEGEKYEAPQDSTGTIGMNLQKQ